MSHSSLAAMPNRPYRVSSRSAQTSPKPTLNPSGVGRTPALVEHQPMRLSSKKSLDVARSGDLPSRRQNYAIQNTLADTIGPQLPQLLSSKSSASSNPGIYSKLKTVKSFFKRHSADSDDDSHDAFDTGRGADPSTASEPGYVSSASTLSLSKTLDPHRRMTRPPTLTTESYGRARDSSQSRPSGIRAEPNPHNNSGSRQAESELQVHSSPNGYCSRSQSPANSLRPDFPSSPGAASSRDSTQVKSLNEPARPRRTLEIPRAGPHPTSRQVIPKSSLISTPQSTGFLDPTLILQQESPKCLTVRSIKLGDTGNCEVPASEQSDDSASTTALCLSADLAKVPADADNSSEDDSSEDDGDEEEEELKGDRTDISGESFEINVACELKPATVCKLVLTETQKNSSLAVSGRERNSGSSGRSSSFSGFTTSGSNRDGDISSCSSLPSPHSPDGEDYINVDQIRHVIKGLNCLLEKLDPQDEELPDPLHRPPSAQSSPSLNHNFRLRINHTEFIRMIKRELDR
ncbi:hypothetical protein PCANC_03974 [Puccinia coronata f. sp. avenae]|uniref:Uncharacterized protein n=1 Tax=Puccinia coronata f. sp. avenae TaxID=200324 RepID=A0A2N5T7X3_9BASI|nr:hypothetical protein PCANC_03974 [Puccinia coronata f. sp. avenae]